MENTLFLACFFGVPVAMVLVLAWLALRAVGARLSWRRALSSGWSPASEADVRALLRGLPALEREGVHIDRIARRSVRGLEVTALRYAWRSRGTGEHRQGRRETWLVLPLQGQAPRVVIAPRSGGLLEAVVDRVAEAAGQAPLELGEAWAWARVHGPSEASWLTEARGQALASALRAEESLILHDRHAVLVLPYAAHPRVLREAEAMVERLTAALH